MIYPYKCVSCGDYVEIEKDHTLCSREEICEKCDIVLTRIWTAPQIMGAKVEHAEYNPAFGQVVKNKRHRDELARRHNLIEIGNESIGSIEKHIDSFKSSREYEE